MHPCARSSAVCLLFLAQIPSGLLATATPRIAHPSAGLGLPCWPRDADVHSPGPTWRPPGERRGTALPGFDPVHSTGAHSCEPPRILNAWTGASVAQIRVHSTRMLISPDSLIQRREMCPRVSVHVDPRRMCLRTARVLCVCACFFGPVGVGSAAAHS
ncbi:hypothetical protein PLICRDRAFT_537516 [Plicaturopsis crispa FD-325 SS-3]|nr:hypothetical protein PLICRDRAFT_537516 [Plicaturopsis crispa FD-325 SS-3]